MHVYLSVSALLHLGQTELLLILWNKRWILRTPWWTSYWEWWPPRQCLMPFTSLQEPALKNSTITTVHAFHSVIITVRSFVISLLQITDAIGHIFVVVVWINIISCFKGIVHPKMKMSSLFTHPHVIPNLYTFLMLRHKRRYFEEPSTSTVGKEIL